MAIGFTAMALPTRLDLPVPGKLAAVVQGKNHARHTLIAGSVYNYVVAGALLS